VGTRPHVAQRQSAEKAQLYHFVPHYGDYGVKAACGAVNPSVPVRIRLVTPLLGGTREEAAGSYQLRLLAGHLLLWEIGPIFDVLVLIGLKELSVTISRQGAIVQWEDAAFATLKCEFDSRWFHWRTVVIGLPI
jgi:hypothetical protein